MPVASEWPFVCPGCLAEREPGSLFYWGPDPLLSGYGPLCWDVECLRNHAWLRQDVRYRPPL
jgi:hypothetical protein